MKFLVALTIIAASVQLVLAAPADKVDCSKLDEVLDDMGAAQGISILNEKYKLPTTTEEYSKRCLDMTEAIKTLRKYNKECFSSLTQQVFSALLRTRSQMIEIRCKPGAPEAQEVVDSTKCIKENAFEAAKEAESKTILTSQVLHDANISDEKLRLRRSCCSVLASKSFFLEATKAKCSKYEKIYSEYVESYTSEAMGLICPDADKLDCDKLEPLKIEGVALKSKFFLNPMLKLIKSLDH